MHAEYLRLPARLQQGNQGGAEQLTGSSTEALAVRSTAYLASAWNCSSPVCESTCMSNDVKP
jgi:hypothetical protein